MATGRNGRTCTAIRDDPWGNWVHVLGSVRGHYQRRIVLVGAERTGKTTLTETLAAHLGTAPIPEYGRDYDALFRHGQTWDVADFEAIMVGHGALAQAAAMRGVAGKTYLLLDPSTPWLDDGTRHFPDPARRVWFTDRLAVWLETFGASWQRVQGADWAERTREAQSVLVTLTGLSGPSTALRGRPSG